MKNLLNYLCFVCLIGSFHTISAQDLAKASDEIPSDYLKRNPIYDYTEPNLNNIDSIPGFESKNEKLMITGIIYKSDGKTRYVNHRGWVKTDADGRYTFYTFIPGNFLNNRELKHIHPTIKESGKPEYELDAFLFDNDPFLSKSCRKRLAKKGIDNILKPEKKESMFVVTKDIILEDSYAELTK